MVLTARDGVDQRPRPIIGRGLCMSTMGNVVPIYWLSGGKAADNYADFYDGIWEGQPTDRDGNPVTSRGNRYHRAWTGWAFNGTKDPTLFMGNPGATCATAPCT